MSKRGVMWKLVQERASELVRAVNRTCSSVIAMASSSCGIAANNL